MRISLDSKEIPRKSGERSRMNIKGLKMKGSKEASYSRTSYFGHSLVGNYSKNTSSCKSTSYSVKDIHIYLTVTGWTVT